MMKIFGFILFILMFACSSRADFTFSWTDCSNRLVGSETVIWQGTRAPFNYSTPYRTFGTNLSLPQSVLQPGINYFATQQIGTNLYGKAYITPMSAEIQIQLNTMVAVDIQTLSSTNLGMNWSVVGNQTLNFPAISAQEFFLTQHRIRMTNQVIYPPPTP